MGEPFGADVRMSSRGPLATNLAHRLALLITDRLGLKARGEKPGLIGRVNTDLRSSVDLEEAWQCGIAAVRAACRGDSGMMVTLERQPGPAYASVTGLVSLEGDGRRRTATAARMDQRKRSRHRPPPMQPTPRRWSAASSTRRDFVEKREDFVTVLDVA